MQHCCPRSVCNLSSVWKPQVLIELELTELWESFLFANRKCVPTDPFLFILTIKPGVSWCPSRQWTFPFLWLSLRFRTLKTKTLFPWTNGITQCFLLCICERPALPRRAPGRRVRRRGYTASGRLRSTVAPPFPPLLTFCINQFSFWVLSHKRENFKIQMPSAVTMKYAMLVLFKLWHLCSLAKNCVCILNTSQIKEGKGGKGVLGAEGKGRSGRRGGGERRVVYQVWAIIWSG